MTVQDLIRALQTMPPALEVRVVLSHIVHDYEIWLGDEEALEADEVQNRESHVLIRSK